MNAPDLRQKGSNSAVTPSSHNKFIVMSIFLLIDVALNSTLDYDTLNDNNSSIVLAFFGLQIIIQISVFLILFLTISDTFLFRVGLLDILLRKIYSLIIVQIVYFFLTILTGALRLHNFKNGSTLSTLTKDSGFIGLSIFQKIGMNLSIINILFILSV